jgi:hypothetical protein
METDQLEKNRAEAKKILEEAITSNPDGVVVILLKQQGGFEMKNSPIPIEVLTMVHHIFGLSITDQMRRARMIGF